MDEDLYRELAEAVRPGRISTHLADRIAYSRDQWPRSLLWTVQGEPARYPPLAVAWPTDAAAVGRVMATALRRRLPVIPYGGGSGVAGATVPTWGGLVVDTKLLDGLELIDEDHGFCVAGAGIVGQHLELELQRRGWTLGHFPSSIYCSCLGGWLAARSAGQMSTLYGKIEDMVLAADVVLPSGTLVHLRREEAGPGWLQALVGSEGTLGIFTRAWLRIHRLPATRRFASFSFPGVEAGLEAIRLMMQAGLRPSAVRLYDAIDTLMAGGRNEPLEEGAARPYGPPARRSRLGAFGTLLGRRLVNLGLHFSRPFNFLAGLAPIGCQLVLVHEGEPELVDAQEQACSRICKAQGGDSLGPGPAEAWYQRRYSVSFKQSKVYDAGAFVDTMEVAATWDRLLPLYQAVRAALSPHVLVLAHFSHSYSEGCSIYFTFVGRAQEGDAERLYLDVWQRGLRAVAEQGATISHHHGVGELKAEYMLREVGPEGRQVFDALKQTLDPSGGMNPGKLWPHTAQGGIASSTLARPAELGAPGRGAPGGPR